MPLAAGDSALHEHALAPEVPDSDPDGPAARVPGNDVPPLVPVEKPFEWNADHVMKSVQVSDGPASNGGTIPPPNVPDDEVALLCEGLERFLGEAEARVHVLRGVSLRLEPGYVHAVVGPSGCGKSSLLYILGLLDRPDAGRLVISGRPVAALPDDELSRQRNALLGFIFQFHFLLQDFTALENIMIPMRQLGALSEPQMRARAADLLDSVGLSGKGQRPSRHLSGGEQQRVAIARALANDPQVILADEPTGNLDTANSTRVFSLLTELVHREQKALLLVTHNPTIAEACDWVHTMRDGLIVEQRFNGLRV
jgi:lipoprotein-releasing system ATP-binding protein